MTTVNISYWLMQTVAMMLTIFLIPNLRVTSIFGPLLIVASLAFVNSTIWDAALFLKIPDAPTAHAAVLILSNGLIFWVLVKVLPGIEIDGIAPALVAPIVFTLCSLVIDKYGTTMNWEALGNSLLDFIFQLKAYVVPG